MIFWFSGTGNSAWAARKIAGACGEEVCNITDLLRAGTVWEKAQETAVFVTPTYAWRIPKPVETWIRRSSFGKAKAWFVMTCGDDIGSAGSYNAALCRDLGMEYMGTAKLIMPENYTAMFETPDPDRAREIVRAAEGPLSGYADLIRRKKAFPKVREGILGPVKSRLINPAFYRFCVRDSAFTVSDACISCGKCAQGCPMKNIVLENGKPVWNGSCTHCMACINGCPMDAVEYGTKSRKRYHYTCPY